MRAQRRWVKSYYKTLSNKLSEVKKSNINFNNEVNFFETYKNKNIISFKLSKNNFILTNHKKSIVSLKKKPF